MSKPKRKPRRGIARELKEAREMLAAAQSCLAVAREGAIKAQAETMMVRKGVVEADIKRKDDEVLKLFVAGMAGCRIPPTVVAAAAVLNPNGSIDAFQMPIGSLQALAAVIRKRWPS